jgi:acetyl esterase
MEFYMPDYTVDYEVNKLDPRLKLSEGMRKVIEWQDAHAKGAFDTGCSYEEMRRRYVEERRFWNEGGPEAAKTVETTVEGPIGPVPVRIYYPDAAPQHHAVVFIHGGGFTVGSNDTHDRMMRSIMASSGCAVIGVDYHLSPEAKFPIPMYECAAVVRYFHESGAQFGILPDRMAIGGDSGGGKLSLATNLYLRDAFGGNDYISALLLYYPGLGLTDGVAHRLQGSELDGMRRCDLDAYKNNYMPEGADMENPYYQIVNADLTHGMPATYLCCGDLDPLLDDSNFLATVLSDRGVPVQLDVVPGVLHAFMHYGRMMPEAVECLEHSGAFFRAQLNAQA